METRALRQGVVVVVVVGSGEAAAATYRRRKVPLPRLDTAVG